METKIKYTKLKKCSFYIISTKIDALKLYILLVRKYIYRKLHHYNKKPINFKLGNEKHI